MERPFELLVFDWDGTLADSLDHIISSMEGAIAEVGLAPRERSQIRRAIGLGMMEVITALYPGLDMELATGLVASYRDHFLQRPEDEINLFPGVHAMLESFRRRGYRLAVATGKSRRGLDRALHRAGLDQVFDATRCADETFSKPHPQMLYDLMIELSVEPRRTLMIGDSEHDLQMALNAGVAAAAIGLDDDEHTDRLQRYDPVVCLADVGSLPAWLEQTQTQ